MVVLFCLLSAGFDGSLNGPLSLSVTSRWSWYNETRRNIGLPSSLFGKDDLLVRSAVAS